MVASSSLVDRLGMSMLEKETRSISLPDPWSSARQTHNSAATTRTTRVSIYYAQLGHVYDPNDHVGMSR